MPAARVEPGSLGPQPVVAEYKVPPPAVVAQAEAAAKAAAAARQQSQLDRLLGKPPGTQPQGAPGLTTAGPPAKQLGRAACALGSQGAGGAAPAAGVQLEPAPATPPQADSALGPLPAEVLQRPGLVMQQAPSPPADWGEGPFPPARSSLTADKRPAVPATRDASAGPDTAWQRRPGVSPAPVRVRGASPMQQLPPKPGHSHAGVETARPAPQEERDAPPQASAEDDAPFCPKCADARPMKYRSARRGGFFWGCARYPACDGTRRPFERSSTGPGATKSPPGPAAQHASSSSAAGAVPAGGVSQPPAAQAGEAVDGDTWGDWSWTADRGWQQHPRGTIKP
jgi:hypothetical protein